MQAEFSAFTRRPGALQLRWTAEVAGLEGSNGILLYSFKVATLVAATNNSFILEWFWKPAKEFSDTISSPVRPGCPV